MRPSLVFAAPYVPVEARFGGAIRTHRLAVGLARAFDVVLVAPERTGSGDERAPRRDEITRDLPGMDVICVPLGRARGGKRVRQAASLLSAQAWDGAYATPALRAAVHAAVRERAAQLVHFDDPGAARCGPVPGAVNVFAPHNIEHEIQRGAAAASAGARRAFARVEAAKLRRQEHAQWRWADLCVAVSEADAETMRRGGARRIVVAPNGADAVERRPPRRWAPGEPLRLLFVGSDYYPNRVGLAWLAGEVLPSLCARLPVVLDVVGMSAELAPSCPGLVAHGRVASVDPFYRAAHVAVVPILYGSGTRLKVVEAMAHGVPVVSTRLGAAGLPVIPNVHYRTADEPDAFAGALVRLAGELAACAGAVDVMLDAARAVAERLFWPEIVDRLAARYEAALDGARDAGAAVRSAGR